MASDRLTIAAARTGMRVVCVDASDTRGQLVEGNAYTISGLHNNSVVTLCEFAPFDYFLPRRFVSADPTLAALLAERAPEFLAAVREWHATFASASVPRIDRALLSAIERAGLIAQEPRTTFHLTPQQFQEMHNAG